MITKTSMGTIHTEMSEDEIFNRAKRHNYSLEYMSVLAQLNGVSPTYIRDIVNRRRNQERQKEKKISGKARITVDVKNRIIDLRQQGLTFHQISQRCGVAISTASKIWKEFSETGTISKPSSDEVVEGVVTELKSIEKHDYTLNPESLTQVLTEINRKISELEDDLADLNRLKLEILNAMED